MKSSHSYFAQSSPAVWVVWLLPFLCILLGCTGERSEQIRKNPANRTAQASKNVLDLEQLIESAPKVAIKALDSDINYNAFRAANDQTILHSAIKHVRPKIVQKLLEKGVDPNEIGSKRMVPLVYVYHQLHYNEFPEDKDELKLIEKLLKDNGAIIPSAATLLKCPDGTTLKDVPVVESYVELDAQQSELVKTGNLFQVEDDSYITLQPYSVESGWHFNPVVQRWDRVSDEIDSYKRPFPEVLKKFQLPVESNVQKYQCRQVIQDAEVVLHQVVITANAISSTNAQSLLISYFQDQGLDSSKLFQDTLDRSVVFNQNSLVTVSIHGGTDSVPCTITVSVHSADDLSAIYY